MSFDWMMLVVDVGGLDEPPASHAGRATDLVAVPMMSYDAPRCLVKSRQGHFRGRETLLSSFALLCVEEMHRSMKVSRPHRQTIVCYCRLCHFWNQPSPPPNLYSTSFSFVDLLLLGLTGNYFNRSF